ncbi:MAG: hypothetical protein WKF77_22780, partial [Planctomycetaceae bacterium]
AARKAAAAKDPAKATLAQSVTDSALAAAKTASMPQPAEPGAAEKTATENRVASKGKSAKKKPRSSDDDVDLSEMFGD